MTQRIHHTAMRDDLEHSLKWPSLGRQGRRADSKHTIFIHPSLRIQHTFNPFHVYTYISHWGSERQSPSLEIIFDLVLTCTGVHPLSGQNPCLYDKEVETGGPMQYVEPAPFTHSPSTSSLH